MSRVILPPAESDTTARGLTVRDVARRYRVSPDKIRLWIKKGELSAINTAATICGKPRWVIPAEALAEFERRRAGGPTPKPPRRRRRNEMVDFFPG
jgi:transposase